MMRLMIDYSKMPAFEDYWVNRKHWVSEEFQNFMDAEIIPASAKAGVNVTGRYASQPNS